MNLKNYFFIFVILFIFLVVISIYYEHITTITNYFKYFQNFSFKSLDDKNKTCKPFIEGEEQVYYSIDGVKYPQFIPSYLNKSINFKCLNKSSSKRILLWTQPDWFKVNFKNRNSLLEARCPVSNCELSSDKSRINESDFVLIHMWQRIENPPKYRPLNQRWIFVLYESPVYTYENLKKWNNFFNMTSTYKFDSDFPWLPNIVWNENKKFNQSFNFYGNKRKFVTAVISNCRAGNQRLNYIKELNKYIMVDVYGNCGKTCPAKFENGKKGDCKMILSKEYKFYLSFENSICKDYITEKLFDIMKYDIIPVVLGGSGYDKYIPKSGYINVLDFYSPKHLADYLIYLDRNQTAYNSYFKWKKYFNFANAIGGFISVLCSMCIHLQLETFLGIKPTRIDDIESYWSLKNDCKIAKMQNVTIYQLY